MAFSTTVQIPSVQAQGPRAEVSQKRLGIPAEQYVPGCQWCSFQLALVMPVVWALLGWLAPYWVIPPALQRSVHMDGHWPLLSWLEWHWAHERHPRHQVFWTLYLIYTYIYIYSDMLIAIHSDTLSGNHSYILSGILFESIWHLFLHSFWLSIWHLSYVLTFSLAFFQTFFLALCLALSLACVRVQAWPTASWAGRKTGVAPLLKSRDPHLAGAEKHATELGLWQTKTGRYSGT